MTTDVNRRRLLLLAPLGLVALGGAAFYAMLERMEQGTFDPHAIGDPRVGKPLPKFDLPGVAPAQGFSSTDVQQAAAQQPVLLNFFASWCIPCVQEAAVLATLSQIGLSVWGIAYEDKASATNQFLNRYGNPYARIADDSHGRTAIDFGVYGVPESFLVDSKGIVRWHMAGPLNDDVVRGPLQNALKSLA